MEKSINYRKASMYYTVGNLFSQGLSFLTVPIFTRILATSDYGIVNTYNSWVAIVSMIMGLALYMSIRTSFLDYEAESQNFLSVIIFFTIIFSFLFSAIAVLSVIFLKINISLFLLILCLLQSFSTAIITDFTQYLMMKYSYKSRTLFLVLPNLISVVLSIILIVFLLNKDLYLGRIVPTAIITLIFALFIIIHIFRQKGTIWNTEYIVYSLKISIPLVFHGISLNVLAQSDRMMLTSLTNASQTGIYSLIYNYSSIATVITTSLEGVWVPWFIKKLKNRQIKEINKLSKTYISLISFAIIVVVLVGPEMIKLLASKKYWEGIVVVPPLVISNFVIFVYTMYVNVEHFHKKTLYISINTMIAAVLNILVNLYAIPKYGYVGAAYSTLFAYIVSLILHYLYSRKLEPKLYPLRSFFGPLSTVFVSIFIFVFFMDKWIVRWGLLILFSIYFFLRQKDMIFAFLKINKSRD